jgi:hypothetical protein
VESEHFGKFTKEINLFLHFLDFFFLLLVHYFFLQNKYFKKEEHDKSGSLTSGSSLEEDELGKFFETQIR